MSYHITDYNEHVIDTAVLSALARQRSSNVADSLRAIFCESLSEDENSIWQAILKFGDEEAFWRLTEQEFGFEASKKPGESLYWPGSYSLCRAVPRYIARNLAKPSPSPPIKLRRFH